MRFVAITLDGEFWDSQIYSGELLLLDVENAVHRIDWHQAIDLFAEHNPLIQTAVRVAFSDSDLFYNQKVRKVLRDPHIEHPIKAQLKQLAAMNLTASRQTWGSFWKKERAPFSFLPADTDIYYNNFFAGGDDGLFSVPRSEMGRSGFEFKTKKHMDARVFQVKASDHWSAVAAAAGNDGLFEFAFGTKNGEEDGAGRRVATRPCTACDWAFQSVMAWTPNGAYLASFSERIDSTTQRKARSFNRLISSEEIFQDSSVSASDGGFAWGCREKMYRLTDGIVEVANYSPLSPKEEKHNNPHKRLPFVQHGKFPLSFDSAEVIATGTAPFGTVFEFDDRLVVIRSDGHVEQFLEEPVHWRVFPRSDLYSNQLHIIYADRLVVVSFVHDYFVDQKSKLSGFTRGATDKKNTAGNRP